MLGHAFCALLDNYPADRLPQHGGTTINLTVELTDLQRCTGHATTAGGSDEDVSISELLRLACTADLVPWVFDSEGQPLWLGRTARLFTARQRKAMAIRDRECRAEGCTMPRRLVRGTPQDRLGQGRLHRPRRRRAALLLAPPPSPRRPYLVKYLPNGDVRYRRRT